MSVAKKSALTSRLRSVNLSGSNRIGSAPSPNEHRSTFFGIELVVMLRRVLKPHEKLSDLFGWRTYTRNHLVALSRQDCFQGTKRVEPRRILSEPLHGL